MKKVLFISNGFAEDLVAITIIKKLRKANESAEISCLPIVGNTKHFQGHNIKIIGPHWKLPSEGLNYGHWLLHFLDFICGLPILAIGQILSLFIRRNSFDLIITVGDYVGIAAAAISRVNAPLVHVWVCPAYYYPKYVKEYLKKHGKVIFSRGQKDHDLHDLNIPMIHSSNPLLDTFEITGESFKLNADIKTIGILPGSRKDAYKNLPLLLEVMSGISKSKEVNFLIALSPKINKEKFREVSRKTHDWSDRYILTDKFGDVLAVSDIIIGLARTANEQALAMGKPVVTFWGSGHSMEKRLVRSHFHQVLMGNAILAAPNAGEVIKATLSLLNDPERMREMGQKGKEIMGPRGGSKIIAEKIESILEQ
jgi:uncharacterized protein (TIGR03492 family)